MSCRERYLKWITEDEDEGASVGHILKKHFRMNKGMISALKWRNNGILMDGNPVHTDVPVHAGQIISVRIDDGDRTNTILPVPIPLNVVFEDDDLAVIDKPSDMLVHGSDGKGAPTLINALASLWGPEQPIHTVHRLDRGTSGLVVIAKNAYVSEMLRRSLHSDSFIREYKAFATGVVIPDEGVIDLPIGPSEEEYLRRCVRQDGQRAKTEYRLIRAYPDYSYVRLILYSGRTHQIRVHLSSTGHPLLGDVFYGGPAAGLSRPALHAATVRLRHPVTGAKLEFDSPLPDDLRRLAGDT